MTNKKKKKVWGGATRGQLALIGVLSVVLVVVIVAQLPESSSDSVAQPRETTRRAERRTNVANSNKVDAESEATKPRQWPAYSVSQLVQTDPLRAPEWYLQAVEVQSNQPEETPVKKVVKKLDLQQLQQAGTNIVLIDDQHRIATIGEQKIRVGDKIDGYQVSDINGQGVVLTKSRSR